MNNPTSPNRRRRDNEGSSPLIIDLPDMRVAIGTLVIIMGLLAFLYKANLFAAIGYGFVDFATVKDVKEDVTRADERFKSLDGKLDKNFEKMENRLNHIDDRLLGLSEKQERDDAALKAHISEYERTLRLFRNRFLEAPKPTPPGIGKSVSSQP